MYACGCLTYIEALKEELPWATDKQLQGVCNIMLFKTASYTTEEIKSKAVLSLNNTVCVAMWSLVMYSNYF